MTEVQVLGLLAAYLLGGVPFGLLAGLSRGVDVRKTGSGNIGATNVIRAVGPALGITVFVLDTLKGLAGVMICRALGLHGGQLATAGLLTVLGHSFSPYLWFKGGKGVATALGAFIGIHPLSAGVCFGLWLVITALTRYVSLGSVIGVAAAPLVLYLLAPEHNVELAVGLAPLSLLVVGRHADNIERLRHGTENRFGRKRMATQPEASGAPAETEVD